MHGFIEEFEAQPAVMPSLHGLQKASYNGETILHVAALIIILFMSQQFLNVENIITLIYCSQLLL